MNFNELTQGRFTGAVSTGNQQPQQPSLLPREPNTPPYKKGEVDINRMEQQEVYLPYGRKHAESFGVKIVLTIQQALELRRKKMAVITIREADIAARWKAPLNSDFLHKALQAIDGLMLEGIPGEPGNPYTLREQYNRGIDFKKKHYHTVSKERQDICDTAMAEILSKLRAIDLPAWPEEEINGFAPELCKPEIMTWEQYREAAKHYIIRDPDTFKEDSDEQSVEGHVVSST